MKKLLFITLLILTFLSCKKDLVDNSKSTTNSDLNLMKRAQKDVFKYFYDYAHPNSKLARERIHENNDILLGWFTTRLLLLLYAFNSLINYRLTLDLRLFNSIRVEEKVIDSN